MNIMNRKGQAEILGVVLLIVVATFLLQDSFFRTQVFNVYSLGQAFTLTEGKFEATGKIHEYVPETSGSYGVDPSDTWSYWTMQGNPSIHPYWSSWEAGAWKKFTVCKAEVTVCGRTLESTCSVDSAYQIRIGTPGVNWCYWHAGQRYEWTAHVIATRTAITTTTTQLTTTTQIILPPSPEDLWSKINIMFYELIEWIRGLFT